MFDPQVLCNNILTQFLQQSNNIRLLMTYIFLFKAQGSKNGENWISKQIILFAEIQGFFIKSN